MAGRFQQGEEVTISVLCVDGNQLPFAPVEAPVAEVWQGGTKLAQLALPSVDVANQTGFFSRRVFLDGSFSVGLCQVVIRYRSSSHAYMAEDAFEVVAGGDPRGAVIALFQFRVPQAEYLVQQLDGGSVLKGQNPTV